MDSVKRWCFGTNSPGKYVFENSTETPAYWDKGKYYRPKKLQATFLVFDDIKMTAFTTDPAVADAVMEHEWFSQRLVWLVDGYPKEVDTGKVKEETAPAPTQRKFGPSISTGGARGTSNLARRTKKVK